MQKWYDVRLKYLKSRDHHIRQRNVCSWKIAFMSNAASSSRSHEIGWSLNRSIRNSFNEKGKIWLK